MTVTAFQGAPKPVNDAARVAALRELNILDSENDNDFNDLAELAKQIFDMPISIISFVDADRQWFKACYGVDIRETPRSVAFCAYTILQDDVMIVTDTALDDRFGNHPLVLGEPYIKFYAGAPILAPNGHKIGTICVIDTIRTRPEFGDDEARILKNLAQVASKLLQNKTARRVSDDSNAAKSEYLSHITHELRTPLTALIGIANLLRRRDDFDARTTAMVRTLHLTAESLLELINGVLDMATIEARNFELVENDFRFAPLVEELEAICAARAAEKGLDFSIDITALPDAPYHGDRLRIKQMLVNLIGNAVKFTDHGSVAVTIRPALALPNMLEIRITDTGIGIAEDRLQAVFLPFVQGHTKDVGQSTGLGLAITEQLVHKMGGKIDIESTVDQGTTFTIWLPDRLRKTDKVARA